MICALWFFAGAAAPVRGSVEDGLVVCFKLDDNDGAIALDSSGNDRHGTLIGTGLTWVKGRNGGALRSRGLDRTARLEFSTAGMSAAGGTASLWAYLANPQPSRTRYLFGHTSERQFANRIELYMDPGGTLLNIGFGDAHVTAMNVMELNLETWCHLAMTWNQGTYVLYFNGVAVKIGSYSGLSYIYPIANFANDGTSTPGGGFAGMLDEARVYDRALAAVEIQELFRRPPSSRAIRPENRADDVFRDVVLAWTPSEWAGTYDVYLGTASADVKVAGRADPRGVLVSQDQDAAEYDPTGPLEYGRTYYWRVDEVNATSGDAAFPGEVWTFTVEPHSCPISSVKATASSETAGMGPENAVNGSGLDGDRHSTEPADMWLSSGIGFQPTWIQFEFDAVCKLDRMQVWNFNPHLEPWIGFGAKDVIVAYSADEEVWTRLGGFVLEQAHGVDAYSGQTILLGGVAARYVRLTINSNWGGVLARYGLGEVRFFQVPVYAGDPRPAQNGVDAPIDDFLSWQPGREVVFHEVYFGDDRQAVAGGAVAMQTLVENRFDPGPLMLGATYFWKVVEINEAGTPPVWEGDAWSFTTREYLAVDDVEDYNDDDHRIYNTWIDGWADKRSGSLVGYMESPFAERMIVHEGEQSMPFEYNNVGTPFYSEARREFRPARDWTVRGADTLALWVLGAAPAYTEDAGRITMTGGGHDIGDSFDDFRFAWRILQGNGSIVVKVQSIEDPNAGAKAGVMIRESLAPESKFVSMVVSPGRSVSMGWRPWPAGIAQSIAQASTGAPQWVKLTRAGSIFSARHSADGITWTDLKTATGAAATANVAMTDPVYVGLCVTSRDPAAMATAVMSDVTVVGQVGGPWQVETIGDDVQPANDPADLYVIVEDSSGRSAAAVHPTAVTLDEWTRWEIPFSSLTGVNVRSIKGLSLGVGGKGGLGPSGRGRIYLDDIGIGRPAAGR